MRAMRFVFPNGFAVKVTQSFVVEVVAVIAAIWLMSTYVDLLHASVARGEQIRAEQQASPRAASNAFKTMGGSAANGNSAKPARLYVEFAQSRSGT